jgi:hypothetical protein
VMLRRKLYSGTGWLHSMDSILQSSDVRNDKYPTISAIYFVVRERIFCDNQGNGAST